MADYTVAKGKVAQHGITLTAGDEAVVTFTDNIGTVDVVKTDDHAAVWYTTDGTEATVNGPNCYLMPAGIAGIDTRATSNASDQDAIDTVHLISDAIGGVPIVSVQRGD